MESIKNIKLSDYKLVAREAILKVIGKKYRDVANSKLDKILFIEHIDVEGLKKGQFKPLKPKQIRELRTYLDKIVNSKEEKDA